MQFAPQLSPFGLTQYVPTDSCLDPSSSNSHPVSTLFAAVGVVKPIAATAYWH